MDLITHSLTPRDEWMAFGVYLNSVTRDGPLVQTVLYLHHSYSEASPKAMEFLRYPHLIPALFNVRGFGPPVRFTAPSTWTWVDHMVSGLRPLTHSPYSDLLSLRLRLFNLTSQVIVTRRFILQKARYHPLTGSNLL